jgi:uncharacterized membrane protein YfcA
MPDPLLAALAQPGLGWLCLIILSAGLVRGFAGFGTGLIFVPLAALFLPPVHVLVALVAADLAGTLPLIPRALREGDRRDVGVLLLGCALCLPVGTALLKLVDPEVFRWLVCGLSLGLVALLASGWRHTFRFSRRALAGIGGVSGFLGGLTGLPGPPVILAYLSGAYDPARIRANTLLFLLGFEVLFFCTLLAMGILEADAFALGVVLLLPYVAGNLLGAALFDPRRDRLYRTIAYAIIAASAITALPIFGS